MILRLDLDLDDELLEKARTLARRRQVTVARIAESALRAYIVSEGRRLAHVEGRNPLAPTARPERPAGVE
ncbi:MAG: hypothetical protein JXA90_17045 [Planctomycetes bacterium]|nr:hypothetical protein [Planctomycetota bacterium]